MKNINKIRKICVTAIVLIFMINTFISAVSALYFNINTIKSIENQLNFNDQFNVLEEPFADMWNVTLEFNEPGLAYDNAIFGEKTDASDGQDGYDVPKGIPSIPPYIRAWFATNFSDPWDELWEEYKHYPDTSKQWNLSVQWAPSDYVTPTTVTISWDTSEVDGSEYNIVKLYNSGGVQLKNMLTESSYSFSCPALTPQIFYIICQANNNAPNQPNNPSPNDGFTHIDINANLGWTCSDPDGDPLTYDIYFGTNSNPPLVQNNQSSNSYDPGTMNNYTTYYWKIVAWDNQVAYTSGPVWSFTTAQNSAPNIPSDPYPTNNATDIDLNADLSWICTDPDGDPLSYDIYFGNSSNPSLVQSNWSETTYDPDILDANTTYYWMIIAWDIVGNSASGPIWNFTTGQQMNENPYEPYNPSPEDGATNVDVNTNLRWNGGDPDGDPVTYDIYFSISYPPQQVASNHTSNVYDPGTLDFKTTYYWKIVAWDNHSARTSGPIWSFTTSNQINRPPIRPLIESVFGILVPNRPYEYNFTSNDPDNDDVFFYVDWGDGTFEDWIGPYFSGETITINHTWPAKTMIYQIKAKAKDTYGSESDWGTFLVFVLSPRGSSSLIIIRIIQRIPILQRLLMIMPLINKLIKK